MTTRKYLRIHPAMNLRVSRITKPNVAGYTKQGYYGLDGSLAVTPCCKTFEKAERELGKIVVKRLDDTIVHLEVELERVRGIRSAVRTNARDHPNWLAGYNSDVDLTIHDNAFGL